MHSDHSITTFKLTHSVLPQPQSTPQYLFDFPKADYNALCSYLMDLDFTSLFLSDNVNFIWSYLKNIILTAMNCFIPKVRLRKYQYPCWFIPELRHFSNCVRTLRRRISKNPVTCKSTTQTLSTWGFNTKEITRCEVFIWKQSYLFICW